METEKEEGEDIFPYFRKSDLGCYANGCIPVHIPTYLVADSNERIPIRCCFIADRCSVRGLESSLGND